MTDYLIGAGVALAVLAFWKFRRGVNEAKQRVRQCAAIAAELDAEGAEAMAQECFGTVVRHLADPLGSGVSNVEVDCAVEMAVACTNRINQLSGGPSGPAFRNAMRTRLVAAAKDRADKIQAGEAAFL